MRTELEVYIESDYTHENKFEAARQRIEKAGFYTQSLFKLIRLANATFESITDDGDAKDAEHYIEDLNNLCEIGSGIAFSVFREASNFSNFKFTENGKETFVSEIHETDNLAALISALLNHPTLPPELEIKFSNALKDFSFEDTDQSELVEFQDSPEYIAKILDGYVKAEKVSESAESEIEISEVDYLAVSLSRILNNANLPITLYNAFQNAIADVYSGGDNETLNSFESSPEFIKAVIEASKKDES